MLIRSVTLENVKSYENATIVFRQGTNAICGVNGAGKTTIIESIGYALFDHTPYRPITNMVKHGMKNGTISVTIEARDGREYTVVRGIKGSKFFIHDDQTDMKIVEGKTDCMDWLVRYCGLDTTSGGQVNAGLSTLFTDVVAVPQGAMTAAFLQRPEQRKATFAPLLKIAGYKRSAESGNEWRRLVEEDRHNTERDISKLAGKTENFGDKKREREKLGEEIAEQKEIRERTRDILISVREKRKFLEGKEKVLTGLKERKAILDTGIQRSEREISGKEQELVEAQRAAEEAGRLRPDYNRSLAVEKRAAELNSRRKERDGHLKIRSGLEVKLGSTENVLKDIRDRLSRISDLQQQADALRPDVKKQIELKERLTVIEGKLNERGMQKQRLEQMEKQAGKLEKEVNDIFQRSAGMEEVEKKAAHRDRYAKIVENLVNSKATLEAEKREIRKNMKATGDGNCPFLGEPCPSEKVGEKGLFSYFEEQLKERIRSIEIAGRDLEAQRSELREATNAKESLSLLKQEMQSARKKEIELEELTGERENLGRQFARDSGIGEECRVTQGELEALGDPQGKYKALEGLIAERPHLEDREKILAGKMTEHAKNMKDIAEKLEPFEGLEKVIDEVERERGELASVRDAYQRLVAEGAKKDDIAKALGKIRDGLVAQRSELKDVMDGENGIRAVERDFSIESLESAREEESSALAALSRAEESGKQKKIAAGKLDRELEEMERLLVRKDELERKSARLERILEIIRFIRSILKKAPERITEAYLKTINTDANRIYRELSGESGEELRWDSSYRISLSEGAYWREFRQLSGGQQMAAALAVRLALLRNLSDVHIAFFDEPTQNLDAERRMNLADAIRGISGFSQLFVISHDDTFHEVTENSVIIGRDGNGNSVVEKIGVG